LFRNFQVVFTTKCRVEVAKEICTRTTYYTHNGKLFSSTGVQLGRTNSFLSPSNKITLEKFATRARALARPPPLGCMENSFDFIASVVYKLAIGKLITGRPARLLPRQAKPGQRECIRCGTEGGIIIIIEFTQSDRRRDEQAHASARFPPE
jgi:hypothetical protein